MDSLGKSLLIWLLAHLSIGCSAVGLGREFNINVGGPAVGRFYPELSPFWREGGSTSVNAGDASIVITGAESKNKAALSSHRWGKSEWGYAIPLAVAGEYECSLHFAETSSFFFEVGKRVFDAEVLGRTVNNIDVYAEAGGPYKSVVKTFRKLYVSDTLFITLRPISGDPFLSAITCVQVEDYTERIAKLGKEFKINCGGYYFGDFISDSDYPEWIEGVTAESVTSKYTSGREVIGASDEIVSALESHRWGRDKSAFRYVLPVENAGYYECSLYFAEISAFFFEAGKRMFNDRVMDQEVRELDVYAEAGGEYGTVVKTFKRLEVKESLTIELTPVKGDAFLSAVWCVFEGALEDSTACPPDKPKFNPTRKECQVQCANVQLPFYNAASKQCEECPPETPFYNTELEVCEGECPGGSKGGGDEPFFGSFELGARGGVFTFSWDHMDVKDRMQVLYEGDALFDTGCVSGSNTTLIQYEGESTNVVVRVVPRCESSGESSEWSLAVTCAA